MVWVGVGVVAEVAVVKELQGLCEVRVPVRVEPHVTGMVVLAKQILQLVVLEVDDL